MPLLQPLPKQYFAPKRVANYRISMPIAFQRERTICLYGKDPFLTRTLMVENLRFGRMIVTCEPRMKKKLGQVKSLIPI